MTPKSVLPARSRVGPVWPNISKLASWSDRIPAPPVSTRVPSTSKRYNTGSYDQGKSTSDLVRFRSRCFVGCRRSLFRGLVRNIVEVVFVVVVVLEVVFVHEFTMEEVELPLPLVDGKGREDHGNGAAV